ncbi:MAG: adenylate/guanylate cyclase domain-containing protein [Solirubrobacteraceae bacterium]
MSASPTVNCAACGSAIPAGMKFCVHCGTPAQTSCSACGEPLIPGSRFCGQCGTPVPAAAPATGGAAMTPTGTAVPAVAERRLISVLFVDLVGFTTMSEHRDPDQVRELMSQYYDRCRALIERYGGMVAKFIGDAVMAVWGTPVAREDDAERAVRAALTLTQAVSLLGQEVGMPELKVRAGVLTGHAAVQVGSEVEGMVLGDTVNTASRLQSIAAPGTVLVDDVTRRASEAAIVYEDAGSHQVKGREQPVRSWTALRVVAGAGGARRTAGLEAPFVGRERELITTIEAFEATAEDSRARLVTVVGEAGAGKSRLLWEFFKYIDGVEKLVRWHQGRCLSYGEGVAYWALAEMVRSRAGIVEEEDPAAAREKLRASVLEHVPDERERRLVEPRLAHLLGLEQRTAADRADLFSGWRLFFERISATEPVILAFEDLQWADSGLLDFIDYLLEWSAEFHIFILALGRPELLAARPDWPSVLSLGPLDDRAMNELLEGLVPGLPQELSAKIRSRAEGMPLYAVETVRMLLDRGILTQEGSRYVVTGDVIDLEVPETLQALVAARLDNLSSPERSLLQDAAVIGQSFTPGALSAVSGRSAAELARTLDSLIGKQVIGFVDDPRSAEHGQYVFLQALLRTIAHGTLSRRDRKAKHLAVAHHLGLVASEETGEVAEVLASHYLAAVEADPEAADASEIRASASQTLADAGRRALSLALGPEARRHFEHAAALTEEPSARGRLLREAGAAASHAGQLEDALRLVNAAGELLAQAGGRRESTLLEVQRADILTELGRVDEARDRVARAYKELDEGTDPETVAELAARLARLAFLAGEHHEVIGWAEIALEIADGRRLGRVFVDALVTKAIALAESGRPSESTALLRHALQTAIDQDLPTQAVRGYYNLADNLLAEARFREAEALLDEGLALARRRGDRQGERMLLGQGLIGLLSQGRWDEAIVHVDAVRVGGDDVRLAAGLMMATPILAWRGEIEEIRVRLGELASAAGWSNIEAERNIIRAVALRETGEQDEAAALARQSLPTVLGRAASECPMLFGEAVECQLAAGRPDALREALAAVGSLQPAQLLPMLDAEAARARALLAAQDGDAESADQWFRRALDLFREMDTPFALARAQLQYAEWLCEAARENAAVAQLCEEASERFEALGARPWLERANALRSAIAA